LPAGEYYVTALADVEEYEWYDPAFLERVVPSSAKTTIAEDEKKAVDVIQQSRVR